jgi:hypothetical protein
VPVELALLVDPDNRSELEPPLMKSLQLRLMKSLEFRLMKSLELRLIKSLELRLATSLELRGVTSLELRLTAPRDWRGVTSSVPRKDVERLMTSPEQRRANEASTSERAGNKFNRMYNQFT